MTDDEMRAWLEENDKLPWAARFEELQKLCFVHPEYLTLPSAKAWVAKNAAAVSAYVDL